MAVINVAGILASRGFRVLVIDMDLEAPGLSYLAHESASTHSPVASDQPGFVDFLLDAVERGEASDLFHLPADQAVRRYTAPYELPPEFKRDPASLHIMPAGRLDRSYAERLERLDLPGLYRAGNGLALIGAFKRVVQDSRLFDYVFIDSRTGFSDESGICTRDLADALMVVSGLNRQNVEGTAHFLKALRRAQVDPNRPIEIILSPVPNGEDELVEERESAAQRAFREAWGAEIATGLHIPYHPRLALTEEPHIFRRRKGYLFEAYHQIEAHVREHLGATPEALSDAAVTAARDRHYSVAVTRLRHAALLADSPEWIDRFLVQFAATKSMPEIAAAEELYTFVRERASSPTRAAVASRIAWQAYAMPANDAGPLFEAALAISPTSSDVLGAYASFLHTQRKDLDAAESFYRRALDADPDHATNLGNFALFLCDERRDFDAAESFYRRALDADPNHAHHLDNFAWFLWHERRDPDAAESFYRRALDAHPNHANILSNFASFLRHERRDLDAAESFYRRALDAAPNHAGILGNFATFLGDERRDPDAAESFYRRALDVDPNQANNLGSFALFLRLERRDLNAAESFYRRALDAAPNHANNLGGFALFLCDERRDLDAAESFYRRALDADPNHANNLANYARLCLTRGRVDEGINLIGRVLALLPPERPSEADVECWMYTYCCGAPEQRSSALARLRHLVSERRITTGNWDFSGVIQQAQRMGHPEAAQLPALAEVLAGRAAPGSLDAWEPWRAASPPQ
ncbi:KGGVGR-motif variant AAA ATPase [Nannocystis pusilla]